MPPFATCGALRARGSYAGVTGDRGAHAATGPGCQTAKRECIGSGQNAAAEGQRGRGDGTSRGEAQCAGANRKGPSAGDGSRTQEIGEAAAGGGGARNVIGAGIIFGVADKGHRASSCEGSAGSKRSGPCCRTKSQNGPGVRGPRTIAGSAAVDIQLADKSDNVTGVVEDAVAAVDPTRGSGGGAAGLLEGAGIVECVAGSGKEVDVAVVLEIPGAGVVDRGAVLHEQVAGVDRCRSSWLCRRY